MSFTRRNQGYGNGNVNTRSGANRGGLQSSFVPSTQNQFQQKQIPQKAQQWDPQQQQQAGPKQPKNWPQESVPVKNVPVSPQLKSALKKTSTQPPLPPPTTVPEPLIKNEPPLPVPAALASSQPDPTSSGLDSTGQVANEDEEGGKKKIFFKAGKISKKERRGRRNQRLRKILQPKNALMVLNELLGGQKFNVLEKDPSAMTASFGNNEPGTFVASVNIEGVDHYGFGKSKVLAKSHAAEVALKHVIMSKLSNITKKAADNKAVDGEGDVEMTTEEQDQEQDQKQQEEDVSWLHIASFAMHKLFTTWDTQGTLSEQEVKTPIASTPPHKRPAKDLPANPEKINPVMLLNQMRPGTTYEDVAREGNSPNITFTLKTIQDGQEFYGKGANKKVARKNCAYAACSKLFNITYSADEYQPTEETMLF